MLFADIFTYLSIALAFALSVPALAMLTRSLWPDTYNTQRRLAEGGVLRSFLTGLIPALILGFIIAAAAKRLGPIPGLLVVGSLLVWALIGLSGYAALVGERLWPKSEPWAQSRNGALVLICSAAFPFVGWFLWLPVLIVTGFGMNLRAIMNRSPNIEPQPTNVLGA